MGGIPLAAKGSLDASRPVPKYEVFCLSFRRGGFFKAGRAGLVKSILSELYGLLNVGSRCVAVAFHREIPQASIKAFPSYSQSCSWLVGGHKHQEPAYTGPREVTIEWLGQGCFKVTSSIGLTIVTDPFNPRGPNNSGKVATIAADIILITHESDTSSYTDLVSGSPIIFRSSMAGGVNRASGVLIRGVQTSSESLVASPKLNVAYIWAMDGIRFCDLGAIEDALTPSEALNVERGRAFATHWQFTKFHCGKTPDDDRTASPEDHHSDGRMGLWSIEHRPNQRKSVDADRGTAAGHYDRLPAIPALKREI